VILSDYCAEFLVHGVDVEGKKCGIEEELVILLGESCPLPVTYGKYSTVQCCPVHYALRRP
jgi:phosphoribosylformimino-5-aminoimidazole carboxamide ribonucleotide (ProFAR) isomerase